MRYRFITVYVLLLLCVAPLAHAALVVNEVMSKNTVTILDEDGAPSDWFELYNNGTSPFNLSGHYATDKASNLIQWRFPDTAVVAPDAYLLVWASSKNRTNGTQLHTSFSLSAGGEPVIITAPDGTTQVSSLPAIALADDQSYGHLPDGNGPLGTLLSPTPGVSNAGALPPLEMAFSHSAGVYPLPFSLAISTNRPAVIHYTLDGSVPTASSPVWNGSLSITDNSGAPNNLSMIQETSPDWSAPEGNVRKATVVRAVAIDGDDMTPVETATYLIGDPYTLPIVSVTTDWDNLFDYETGIYLKGIIWDQAEADGWQGTSVFHPANYREEWERPVHLEMLMTDGSRVIDQDVGMQISGQGSRRGQQKSLRFYARGEYGPSSIPFAVYDDQPAITGYKRLTLRNPDDGDRSTFLRDVLAQQLAQAMGGVASENYRPVVAFLNGEYWGLYPLREKANQHYLESHYGVDKDEVVILEDNALIDEGQPGDEVPYTDLVDYARTHDLSDPAYYAYVQQRMDTDSFLRYYLLETYIGNTDWPSRNVVFWRLKTEPSVNESVPYGHDGRWRWVLHDADYAFSYMPGQDAEYDMFEHIERTTWGGALWRSLVRNEEFRDEFVNAAADELQTTFDPADVVDVIDDLAAGIAPEIPEQTDRWTGLSDLTQWENNIEALREYVTQRPAFYREHLIAYFGLGGTAELSIDGDATRGVISINGRGIELPSSGTYFQDVPLTVSAEPAPGKYFLGWRGAASGSDPVISIVLADDTQLEAVFADAPGAAPTDGAQAWRTRKWPATRVSSVQGDRLELAFAFANPSGSPTAIGWSVDGVVVSGENSTALSLEDVPAGNHTVRAIVTVGSQQLVTAWDVEIVSSSGLVCYSRISELPASCVGGVILPGDDILSGSCRTVTCTSASGSKRVFACEKPSSQNPVWFEMYRQATTDPSLKVCLAATCIGSNGFAQEEFADACVVTGVTRDIAFSTLSPSLGSVVLDVNESLNFSYAVSNPADLPVGSLWWLDGSVLPFQEDLASYDFIGFSEGTYNLTVVVSSNETSISNTWMVQVVAGPDNGTVNQTNASGLAVALGPAPWFPQGRNVVWKCNATGGNGTIQYKFTFGDGQQGPSGYTQDNIWHTYAANGTYNASCNATDAFGRSGNSWMSITLGTVPPSGNQTNQTNQTGNGTGNQTNTTQNISFVSSSPVGSSVAISEPASQAFSYVLSNPSGLPVTATWMLDGVAVGNGASYSFPGGYATQGDHVVNVTVVSSQNTIMRSWALAVADVAPPGNSTPNVSVAIAPWFPQGSNYVFLCNATGLSPVAYDWQFGDGHKQIGSNRPDVYHTYAAAGSYQVTCTAHDGSLSAGGTLPITVA